MKATTSRGVVIALSVALLAVPIAAGCGDGEKKVIAKDSASVTIMPTGPTASREDVLELAEGGNQFAFDLYGRLAGDGNLFFSPYSISAALAMTAAGARGNTEREMASVLRLPLQPGDPDGPLDDARARVALSFAALQEGLKADPETRGYELNIANSLWGQEGYPFKEPYIKMVGAHYGGGFNRADFQGNAEAERVRINRWVEGETRERIKDLIPPGGVDAASALVLTNAVYFKGTWLTQFDEKTTRDAPFHGERGDATVPMMYQKSDYGYFEDDAVQVLEMPYAGEDISMLVVLPREGVANLAAVDENLTAEALSGWSDGLREKEVKVYFPRFEMTWGTENIAGHLIDLGMIDAFSSRADFSGMTDLKDLFIGPVFHKAFVAVNEEGTEAAAATAVVMKRLAIEHETVFRADRPFLFVIRDRSTSSILFMGRVADLG
jgi:serpin B